MPRYHWNTLGLGAGLIAGAGYVTWRRRKSQAHAPRSVVQPAALLTRAATLIRLPTAPEQQPEVLADGSGLRCPVTGRVYPYRDGVLDLLVEAPALSGSQHMLNTPLSAWAYDRFRGALLWLAGAPQFPRELAATQALLQVKSGDTLLDLACGHGNFTAAWAELARPEGLVLGLDISSAMLARAAKRVRGAGLGNVLLIRGDAQRLPLSNASLAKVNCSGGFHQLPDLPRALSEIARVSQPGAVLTASTFAEGPQDAHRNRKRQLDARFNLHFVPLVTLGEQLEAVGYTDYRWSLPGGWFGYTASRKRA